MNWLAKRSKVYQDMEIQMRRINQRRYMWHHMAEYNLELAEEQFAEVQLLQQREARLTDAVRVAIEAIDSVVAKIEALDNAAPDA